MRLITLSLVAGTLVQARPGGAHRQVDVIIKDRFDKCTIIRDHAGDTIYDCPGCTLIIDREGKLKLRTGEECSKYCDDDCSNKKKKKKNKPDLFPSKDGCQVVRQPNGDILTQCPGCQRIIDKDGNTKLEQGPHCSGKRDGCQTVRNPNGDTIIQCPGCQKIIDKDGKTKLKQGPRCKHEDDSEAAFGEAYENEGLIVQ